MRIAITTESTVDLQSDLLQKYDIHVIPYNITLGDKCALDGVITPDEIFSHVDETGALPKTSAINEYQYTEFFGKILESYDAIIHFCLSSRISLAYSNAVSASKEFKDVYVVDTQSLSTGIALLAINAAIMRETIDDPKEIYRTIYERMPHVQASFVVHRLDYLHKGGRCTSIQLLGANLLKLRPQIILHEGSMSVHKKYKGKMNKVIANYCRDILEEFNTPDKSIGFVTYTTATPEMIEAAKNALIEAGFENIYETRAGATISSHCGPNTLGILYLNDGPRG